MALFFGNKKNSKRVDLYVPEVVEHDKYSKWRKSEAAYMDDPRALRKYHKLISFLLTISNLANIALALILLIGVVRLTFFTDFERVVFDDGTYLSCVVEPDGTITNDF